MMRLLSIALCFVLPILLVPALSSQEKPAAAAVTISWHGQSFFTLKTSKGTTVVFDPHLIPEYGRVLGLKADVILMSHNHSDHVAIGVIENAKQAKLIPGLRGGGIKADWNVVDEQVKDVHIRSVGVYHDTTEGMERGKNTVFIVEADGWKVAHLGDLGHTLSPAQVKKIGPVDVLMIPVGGIYTLNGNDAREVVAQLKPKEYIFPMHLGTKVYDELLPVNEFVEDLESSKDDRSRVLRHDDNSIVLNRDPRRPRPLFTVLHYWPKGKRD